MRNTVWFLPVVALLSICAVAADPKDEAAIMREGNKVSFNNRGGNWKVVVGEMGVLEQRALAVLTERMTFLMVGEMEDHPNQMLRSVIKFFRWD